MTAIRATCNTDGCRTVMGFTFAMDPPEARDEVSKWPGWKTGEPPRRPRGRPRGSVDRTASALNPVPVDAAKRRASWIGPAIREAREAANVSGEELANRVGVHKKTLGDWEAGTNPPPLHRVIQVASALGVTVASLCGELDL